MKEHGDKISAEDKAKIEKGLTDIKEALKGNDLEILKTKTKELTEASMKLGEAIYKSQQTEQKTEPEKTADDKENVVDAEFEDVKK